MKQKQGAKQSVAECWLRAVSSESVQFRGSVKGGWISQRTGAEAGRFLLLLVVLGTSDG